jgi:hypothetical protein
MPEPRPRSPAQIEASRRNGARSQGPVTPEGKAKASRNALRHGLTAMHHLVLEDEVPDALEELIERLTEETGAASEVEARLARRLAIAFWKGERAEKMEVALLDAAPRTRMNGYRQEEADPLTTFDVTRFNAIRGHQAAQGREISRCLKELRLLRREPLLAMEDEPEPASRNEPDEPAPPLAATANDDRPRHGMEPISGAEEKMRNEPDNSRAAPARSETIETLRQAIRAEIAAQTEADEPDPEHLMALTRRLSLVTLAASSRPLRSAGLCGTMAEGEAA